MYKILRKKAAFTLVELIIVIAIITLLASVVVVTINPSSIFANSRNSQRGNDLKTINTAIQRYLGDSPITGGTQRTLYDLTGYSLLLNDAVAGTAACNGGVYGTGITSVTGAYNIDTSGTNILDVSLLVNSGYLPKVPKDPSNSSAYKACIDITNGNKLVVYAPNLENGITNPNYLASFGGLEGPTTNYVYNPSAEVDTSNWACYDNSAGCTLSRITTDYKFGTAAFRVQSNASGSVTVRHRGRQAISQYGLTAGSNFCMSGNFKVNAGSNAYLIMVFVDGGGSVVGNINTPLISSTSWTRTQICTATPVTAVNVDFKIVLSVANTDTYVDGLQIEPNKTTATSYVDGSLGANYGWNGTANASSSYRLR